MTSLYEIATTYRADAARLQDLDLPAEVVTDTLDAMAGGTVDPNARKTARRSRNT